MKEKGAGMGVGVMGRRGQPSLFGDPPNSTKITCCMCDCERKVTRF